MSSTSTAKRSWRDFKKVHPSADVFPLMDADELRKLADDIAANGLRVPIQERSTDPDGALYVVDGRNRLDAMELLGWPLVDAKGEWTHHVARRADGTTWRMDVEYKRKDDSEIAAEVISLNIHRRHLTKQQQVELIDKVLKAASANDSANMARSFSPVAGKKGGSTKNQHKAAVVTEAAKVGISKRTVERALTETKPEKPKPKREPKPPEPGSEADIRRTWKYAEDKIEFAIASINFLMPPLPEIGRKLISYGRELMKEGERVRMVKGNK